jgi:DNA-binding response OmpR family regulator
MALKRILIVDDEPDIRQFLAEALTIFGFQAIVARTGEEALTSFERERPDGVFLDLNLPGMPGWEVCRILKARHAIPILMITGNTVAEATAREQPYQPDAYLIKPFELQSLIDTLNRALAHYQT